MRTAKDFKIKLAGEEDFLQIHELLRKNGLSTAEVDLGSGSYYVANNQELIGVIGFQTYGAAALLRSLFVEPQFRNRGIAQSLLEHTLQILQNAGIVDVYLQTNTAEVYLRRFGFREIEREEVLTKFLESSTLGDRYPSAGVCMYLQLKEIFTKGCCKLG